MSASKHIYLSGFMGSGKSTIAKAVSKKIELPFLDTDQSIEEKQQKKIPQIFSDHGEEYFRDLETQTLIELSQSEPHVVSLGGGAILREKNREIISQGYWINLNSPFSDIYQRIKSKSHRPLVTGKSESEIQQLWQDRKEFYALAPLQIDTEHLNSDKIAEKIAKLLKKEL